MAEAEKEQTFVACLDLTADFLDKHQELARLLREGWFELARARYGSTPTCAADNLQHAKQLDATVRVAVQRGGEFQVAHVDARRQPLAAPASSSNTQDGGSGGGTCGTAAVAADAQSASFGKAAPPGGASSASSSRRVAANSSSGLAPQGGGTSIIDELAAQFGCNMGVADSGDDLSEEEEEGSKRQAQTAVLLASPQLRAAKDRFMQALHVAADLAGQLKKMEQGAASFAKA